MTEPDRRELLDAAAGLAPHLRETIWPTTTCMLIPSMLASADQFIAMLAALRWRDAELDACLFEMIRLRKAFKRDV